MSIPEALRRPSSQALFAGSLSGLLAFLSFPPADLAPLAFVCLVPLAWFFARANGRQAAVASAAFSLVFFGPLIWWIRLFGPIAYVGLVLAQSLWVVGMLRVGHFLKSPLARSKRPWLVFAAFPIAFMAGEYLRTHLPLGGFGWGGLGYTQHNNTSILKLAAFTGVWGVSLIVVLVNTFLAALLSRRPFSGRRAAPVLATALLLPLAPAAMPSSQPQGESVKIAMVQANVPENTHDPKSDDFLVLDRHLRLTREASAHNPSLIVWPEGSFDRDPSADDRLGKPLVRAVKEANTFFHVGAILFDRSNPDKVRNSSLFLRPNGSVAGVYSKQHPVPFGEWIPFREVLVPLIKELERVPYDQIPGTESTVFTLPEGKFASVICYESTYPALVRSFVRNGARLLVVSTNDSSFGRTPASSQHLSFSQVRAAEHRMWVAHTAVSGISAVVDPGGKVLEKSALFESNLFVPEMRFATGTTFYARVGDWVPAIVLVSMAVLVAFEIFRRFRDRPKDAARRLEENKHDGTGHPGPESPESDEPVLTIPVKARE